MTITDVAGAQALGIDPEKLDILLTRCRKDVDDGLLPSCQVALARDGRLAAFETFGTSTNDTRYVIFSATKAVVASAVWLLIADESLDISKRVVDYIPEFGTNGKDVVTVEQVLLHTSGFPHAPLGPPQWSDRAQRLERFSQWRLNWEPGTRHEYHPTPAHWVRAAPAARPADATGRVRNRFPDPLTGVPANRGLGVVIAGDDGRSAGRGLGHTVSPRAFGHNGAGGQVAWADPDTGLSFVYLTNGLDRNQLREWRRSSGVASKAAVCAA